MFTIVDRKDLIRALEELIMNCDGVVMTAKSSSHLHNFAVSIRTALQQLSFGIENGMIEENVEHD